MASGAGGCGPRSPKDAQEPWKGAEQAKPELGPRRATGDTAKVAAGYLGHLGSVPLQNRQGREHPTSTLVPMIFLQEKTVLSLHLGSFVRFGLVRNRKSPKTGPRETFLSRRGQPRASKSGTEEGLKRCLI